MPLDPTGNTFQRVVVIDPASPLGAPRVNIVDPIAGVLLPRVAVIDPSTGLPVSGSGITTPAYDPATLTVSGRAPVGSTVVVKVDGVTSGTVTAGASGAWSYVFGSAPAAGALITAVVTSTTGGVTVPDTGGVRVPPAGFVYLTDPDGARSKDPDGAYLMEPL